MAPAKRALITGIAGQDGSYLAQLLLDKGYEVHGLVRGSAAEPRPNLSGFQQHLTLHRGDLRDAASLSAALRASRPHEVYNFAAVTHVPASWDAAAAGAEINALGVLRLLDAIVESGCGARFLQASSSEMFPGSDGRPQDESTPLRPRSPYGAAKAYGHLATGTYRRTQGLFACSAILFNHESPRRGERFVTRRVSRGVAAIKLGLADELPLGNLEARRDWGWAPEYVEACWAMLQAPRPDDYVIGTGAHHSVRDLVRIAFDEAGLEPDRYLRSDPGARRPADAEFALADAAKARRRLDWAPRKGFEQLVREMVRADLSSLRALPR